MPKFVISSSGTPCSRCLKRLSSALPYIVSTWLVLAIIATLLTTDNQAIASSFNANAGLQEAAFTLDNVPIHVYTPFLPDKFYTSDPGEFDQAAGANRTFPSEEFTIAAIPFGYTSPVEGGPVAQAGSAGIYRAMYRDLRIKQGGKPRTGPAATLFGQQVIGQVSQVSLFLESAVLKPTWIVEWVTEAGSRIWIVRVGKELARGENLDTPSVATFLNSLKEITITSDALDNPTTLSPNLRGAPTGGMTPGMPATGSAQLTGGALVALLIASVGVTLCLGGMVLRRSLR